MRVILASASPRRRELLASLFASFEVIVSDVDEEALTVSDPWETATSLAEAKAGAVARRHPDALVIGADTVVALGNDQLAKPSSKEEAVAMLRQLSGQTHVVITGVATVLNGHLRSFSDTTHVSFRPLCEEEILRYVSSGEPMDKAGAYAIQGGAAGFVSAREGSLTNVIGLPLEALTSHLRSLAVLAP
jgi:septum formation protein